MMDINEFRKLVPVTSNYIYLNHASVSPPPLPVLLESLRVLLELSHHGSITVNNLENDDLNWARRKVARLFNVSYEEISFVPNTSYGVNMVVHGLDLKEGDEVITDSLEFPTVVFPLLKLKKRGVIIKIVNTSLENFENDILSNFTNRTKLVSISHVSFNTGIRVDVKSIVKEAKRVGAYVLLDIIQSAGAINVDLRQLDVDFAVAGSYKWLMSPHGTGIFYVKKGLIKDPPLYGWKSTKNYLEFNPLFFELEEGPRRFEIGSNDLSAIAGLTKACEILSPIIDHVESRVMMLSKLVIELASEHKLEVVTPLNKRAGIVVIKASNSKKIVERLQKENNIIVSPRGSGIRISTHFYNTEEEVRVTIEKLSNILNNI